MGRQHGGERARADRGHHRVRPQALPAHQPQSCDDSPAKLECLHRRAATQLTADLAKMDHQRVRDMARAAARKRSPHDVPE
jgi:hypothetical protein